jgi:deoxyadenosine/deoxycytidine kinase
MMIAIVGPCGSGKTVLVNGLKQHDYHARQIAQEHSFVQNMWQVLTKPDLLIYLDASYETCTERKAMNWKPREFAEQLRRLSHAREHCDIYLSTDDLSTEKVLKEILAQLQGISS